MEVGAREERPAPRVVARVAATKWHESQELKHLPGGGVEVRPWILGWGKEGEVVPPTNLRESILAELEDAAAAYGRPTAQRSMAG